MKIVSIMVKNSFERDGPRPLNLPSSPCGRLVAARTSTPWRKRTSLRLHPTWGSANLGGGNGGHRCGGDAEAFFEELKLLIKCQYHRVPPQGHSAFVGRGCGGSFFSGSSLGNGSLDR